MQYYDPVIGLLDFYPEDTNIQIQRSTHIPVCIAALSTIAKVQKEPKSPSVGKWGVHTHPSTPSTCVCHGVLLGHQNETLPLVPAWMELEVVTLSKVTQRKTNTISLIRGI